MLHQVELNARCGIYICQQSQEAKMNKSMMALLIVVPLLVIGIATLLILRSGRVIVESNSTTATPLPAPVSSASTPSLSKMQSTSEANNQRLDKQIATQQIAPSPDADVPNLAQLRAFGEKIADGWCGASGEKDPFGYIHHHVLRDILKNSTTSLIHPNVWTFVVDETDDHGGQTTFNFKFYWNGHRLAASDSTAISPGDKAPDIVDVIELDKIAQKIQNQ
jgi:hypothetical protein